jgi:hypothetical protein
MTLPLLRDKHINRVDEMIGVMTGKFQECAGRLYHLARQFLFGVELPRKLKFNVPQVGRGKGIQAIEGPARGNVQTAANDLGQQAIIPGKFRRSNWMSR